MTASPATIFDILGQPHQTRRNRGWDNCYLCPLPGHSEAHPSFVAHNNGTGFKCHGCGAKGGVRELRRLLGHDYQPGPIPEIPETPERLPDVTVDRLAGSKGLNLNHLLFSLKWDTASAPGGGLMVKIPYFGPDGRTIEATRERRHLEASPDGIDDRFKWTRGAKIIPYGLWKIPEFRRKGEPTLLTEGETDPAMCWQHGIPAIGLPGATTWKPEFAHYFQGIEVVAWQEPGPGGKRFIRSLLDSFPNLRVVQAPHNAKDPVELAALVGPEKFATRLRAMIALAWPASELDLTEDVPISTPAHNPPG
jgi:putative DNA primase/helicase